MTFDVHPYPRMRPGSVLSIGDVIAFDLQADSAPSDVVLKAMLMSHLRRGREGAPGCLRFSSAPAPSIFLIAASQLPRGAVPVMHRRSSKPSTGPTSSPGDLAIITPAGFRDGAKKSMTAASASECIRQEPAKKETANTGMTRWTDIG
jgi:hypothetical protein